MPPIGLILTSAPSVAWLRTQLQTAKAQILKVVPSWGLPWNEATIREVAQLAPQLVVRTSWGDPSYRGNGKDGHLLIAAQVLAELRPWLDARPDAWVELGNEPLIADQASERAAWDYRYHLEQTIDELRRRYPRVRLIGPAHLRNHLVRLGEYQDGQGRWDAICGDQLRRCDALGLHAYSVTQAVSGLKALRDGVSGSLPIWLTEFALNEQLEPAARGRKYREILDVLPVAAAMVYHLDHAGGTDPAHFRPEYQLQPLTLAALAGPAPAPAQPAGAPVRPAVASVPMSRESLTRGRPGPVTALVMHATAGRWPGDLNWLRQGGAPANPVSCHYYIDKAGAISQLVADHDTAWHAGQSQWRGLEVWSGRGAARVPSLNPIALGIELENRNDGKDPYPEAQYRAAVALARHLVYTHRIARVNLVRHLDISPGRKTDPAGFPWSRFVADVYQDLP